MDVSSDWKLRGILVVIRRRVGRHAHTIARFNSMTLHRMKMVKSSVRYQDSRVSNR